VHSSLYVGTLEHRRLRPRAHAFRYRLFMLYLDLAELDRVFAGRWFWSTGRRNLAWLRRADYLGDPGLSIDEAVRQRVTAVTGTRPSGPIRMLTHLRLLGYCFNPLTVYYCFDPAGSGIEAIVAEITNTPWRERHSYVLTRAADPVDADLRARFAKSFHVSPFMPMEMEYAWRFSNPAEQLAIFMSNHEQGRRVFEAHLDLRRRPITGATLARALLRFPPMTITVHAGIYLQALRLWWKGTPVHPHPGRAGDSHNHARQGTRS